MSTRIDGERQETATQDVADSSPLNPQLAEIRENVARALYDSQPEYGTHFPFASIAFENRRPYHGVDPLHEKADAAILAVLEELIEIELPEEAVLAAVVADTDAEIFRAILTVLQSMIAKEVA